MTFLLLKITINLLSVEFFWYLLEKVKWNFIQCLSRASLLFCFSCYVLKYDNRDTSRFCDQFLCLSSNIWEAEMTSSRGEAFFCSYYIFTYLCIYNWIANGQMKSILYRIMAVRSYLAIWLIHFKPQSLLKIYFERCCQCVFNSYLITNRLLRTWSRAV